MVASVEGPGSAFARAVLDWELPADANGDFQALELLATAGLILAGTTRLELADQLRDVTVRERLFLAVVTGERWAQCPL